MRRGKTRTLDCTVPRVPNTAHFNLLAIPTGFAFIFAGIVIGNLVITTLLLFLIVMPAYGFAYLKYFALFPHAHQRKMATIGFVGLQLTFWGLVFLIVRIATFRPSAI
jgi:hypothetical protein